MHQRPTGLLSESVLRDSVAKHEIDTVLTVFPDLYGRLVGKRYTADFFCEEVLKHGMHACDYLLACDMEMDPVPGYRFASWEKGYGDVRCVPDLSTLRSATWLERTVLVLCDVYEEPGEALVAVAPRTILKRQVERAAAAGYVPMGASELEFFVLRETYETARQKGFDRLETAGSFIEDYHTLQGFKVEPLIGAIRHHADRSGIPVESSKGEWGPGQQEINLRYTNFLRMADRHVIYKQLVKEIGIQNGLAVTFMAKFDEQLAGSSMHLHSSLWKDDGRTAAFAGGATTGGDARPTAGGGARPTAGGDARPTGAAASSELPDLCRWWLGGLMHHARACALLFAPTVNSYKRFRAGSFAPTAIAWAFDNRTAGFRIVGSGSSLRVECRIPGADANPYLAFAATLAAGLDGIANKIEPPPRFAGDAYTAANLPRVPATLPEAIAEFEASALFRDAFGADVVEHLVHFARTEQRKFDETVTTWERRRYLERV
jgi:glutamine synthetase